MKFSEMKFSEMKPEEYETARIDEIKRQMREAMAELENAKYMWIIAARMTRICADLHEICSGREWRRGYQAGLAPLVQPRIGSGVTITDGEVR